MRIIRNIFLLQYLDHWIGRNGTKSGKSELTLFHLNAVSTMCASAVKPNITWTTHTEKTTNNFSWFIYGLVIVLSFFLLFILFYFLYFFCFCLSSLGCHLYCCFFSLLVLFIRIRNNNMNSSMLSLGHKSASIFEAATRRFIYSLAKYVCRKPVEKLPGNLQS